MGGCARFHSRAISGVWCQLNYHHRTYGMALPGCFGVCVRVCHMMCDVMTDP